MKTQKTIGIALIFGAIGVFIPYTLLTISFDYPDVLRQETSVILTKFQAGGPGLILTWWAFAILGLPLLIAYIKIGQLLESKVSFVKWVTTLGVISGVVQIIGLLRWVFVVPVLAQMYSTTTDPSVKSAIEVSFQVIHQFGGVLLGEHLGQLFTIIWSVMISIAFMKEKIVPNWVNGLGIISSLIYLMAQAEVAATVIPKFPLWDLAGFLGSTLWLVWLIIVGIIFIKKTPSTKKQVEGEKP